MLWEDEEFRIFIYFILATSCLITLSVYTGTDDTFLEAVRHSFFMVASFSSTTGFASTNYEQWPAVAKLTLMLLYFTGGCAGSTAGAAS